MNKLINPRKKATQTPSEIVPKSGIRASWDHLWVAGRAKERSNWEKSTAKVYILREKYACKQIAKARNLDKYTDFQVVTPGPLSFANVSVDLVYSKDAIIHISDKNILAADVYRVLKPGGRFSVSTSTMAVPID